MWEPTRPRLVVSFDSLTFSPSTSKVLLKGKSKKVKIVCLCIRGESGSVGESFQSKLRTWDFVVTTEDTILEVFTLFWNINLPCFDQFGFHLEDLLFVLFSCVISFYFFLRTGQQTSLSVTSKHLSKPNTENSRNPDNHNFH